MVESVATKSKPISGRKSAAGRLFVLELSGDRIHSMNVDGSDRKTIVTDCHLPDGIVVDAKAGHIYWTNMGDLQHRQEAQSRLSRLCARHCVPKDNEPRFWDENGRRKARRSLKHTGQRRLWLGQSNRAICNSEYNPASRRA